MAVVILRSASTGPEVEDLQYLLHFRSPVSEVELGGFDGVFGPRTEAAVKGFQTKKALTADGVVGPKTWTALGPAWPRQPGDFQRQGDRGADVRRLQQGLISKGFNPGPDDGIFGPRTRTAVIALQNAGGAQASNRQGVVGPLTWGPAIAD